MSYILDALKKAESERALGSVPDIHAQPVPMVRIDGKPVLWRRPLVWIAAALVTALAVLLWLAPWRAAPSPAALTPQAAAPAPQSSAAPAVQQPSVTPAAPVAAGAPPAAVAAAPSREPAPVAAEAEPRKPKPRPREKPAEPAIAAQPPAAKPVETPAAPVAEAYVPALRELPPNIQREIPALAVGGYIYASKPAERSILINNRLLREGEQIAPGLTLEKMTPHAAVLNYRGYRYRIPY